MHMSFQKSSLRRILFGYGGENRPSLSPESRFEGDEDMMYLHCDTERPSMSCDGLVCILSPDWVNVLNPSTGEIRSFPSGPDPVPSLLFPRRGRNRWYTCFPGYWAMGFGRDKVTGSYKVGRMWFYHVECDVLAVETGEWRRLSPPP
ncbi:F-box/LRR-repeat protein At2g43260 [Eutrema salsugineum]|uniref:F-box/LRR-repeat protein At2g43260 n=1 Tax=Eutrema salsugineum TaxID=72664 RepID=UPI000CED0C56|nr:F-box/LRR-repeat protein At2g43260 [Eutrema salsugineum]